MCHSNLESRLIFILSVEKNSLVSSFVWVFKNKRITLSNWQTDRLIDSLVVKLADRLTSSLSLSLYSL